MEIEITQKHIDEGNGGDARNCAIARALKDKGYVQALVGVFGHVSVRAATGEMVNFERSEAAATFIEAFDRDKKLVSPMKLTLSPIQMNDLQVPTYAYIPQSLIHPSSPLTL